MQTQTHKRILEGTIISDRMDKTRVVVIARTKKHQKYQKYFTVTTRIKAHDEKNEYKTGDRVKMEETRPLSKEKRWKIIGKSEMQNVVAKGGFSLNGQDLNI